MDGEGKVWSIDGLGAALSRDDLFSLIRMLRGRCGLSAEALLLQSGVDFLTAARLIRTMDWEAGPTFWILAELLAALPLPRGEIDEVIQALQNPARDNATQRLHVEFLVHRFVTSNRPMPRADIEELVDRCLALVPERGHTTALMAARRSPPRKVMDVAHIYQEMKAQRVLGRPVKV